MSPVNSISKKSRNGAHNHIEQYVLNTRSIFQNVVAYIWNVIAALLGVILFRVLNKTVVEGRSNLKLKKNTLIVSNHQTLIDSFFIGVNGVCPGIFIKPSTIPWHPAALENFFKNKFLAFCSRYWKCIPIKRGTRDFLALGFMIEALKSSTMILYPEGTRSRTGKLGKGKIGVGKLIYETRPVVVPVAISGMNEVLPIGVSFPRFCKVLRIKFGEPLSFDDLYQKEGNKETSQEITDRIMNTIQELKKDIDKKRTGIIQAKS